MRRDWRLIRAILRSEPLTQRWDDATIIGHYLLCQDRGLVEGTVMQGPGNQPIDYVLERITNEGHEMAQVLSNVERLEQAMATLDARQIGHSEDILLGLIRQQQAAH